MSRQSFATGMAEQSIYEAPSGPVRRVASEKINQRIYAGVAIKQRTQP